MNLWTRHHFSSSDGDHSTRLVLSTQPFHRWALWALFHHLLCKRAPGWRNAYVWFDLRCFDLAQKGRVVVSEIEAPDLSVGGEPW